MTSLLFDVSPVDPLTYVAVALLLMTATLLASYIPARRISRVDPGRGDAGGSSRPRQDLVHGKVSQFG